MVVVASFAASACAGQRSAPAHKTPSTPAVFVEARGKCPLHPTGVSPVCRRTRSGNGVAGSFALPPTPWGIAYAFNCGHAPGDFFLQVGLPAMDAQLPETGFLRHSRTGRGVFMETGKGLATWKSLPKVWQWPQDLVIASTCAWHVRAVHGSPRVVSQHIPPVPAA